MPIHEENVTEDDHDMQWINFDKMPLMSADNMMIIITKLVPLSDLHSTVVFWCRKNETEDVQYAKAITSSVMQYVIKHIAKKDTNIQKLNYVTIWNIQDDEMNTRELVLHR